MKRSAATLLDQSKILQKISGNIGFDVGGFRGLHTLQRLTIQIDYRDDLIKLSYDPKKDVIRSKPNV